ncbi:PerC family transcriptional regulator [Buttiauxella sp. 3AFRM03]|uniref:PerC family transcriptional regulator n=1 Tax=Buttiauxella sp. 3AFRM03 TaxID=2479367 RepID=UPI000EF75B8C|nr:PerC family transcriptional regulator [Buttiauxella sp. 3AFRM03]AYN30428.1 PerC family transcriptional regulator [Buttiauxella sp. 3AFRM03]
MVKDSKAEALEAKGLYHRAASRWLAVMALCTEETDRDWITCRRVECMEKARRPPVKADDYGDLHRAVTAAQHRMGISQPNGNAFRLPESRKKQRET